MSACDLPIPSEQLRHAADLLEKAKASESRTEVLALLGSVREICERVAGELGHVLDPHGDVVHEALRSLRGRELQ